MYEKKSEVKNFFSLLIYNYMDHIKFYQQFESFSIKSIDGKRMVYCSDCKKTFNLVGSEDVKMVCPSCGSIGFISKDLTLKPIYKKI